MDEPREEHGVARYLVEVAHDGGYLDVRRLSTRAMAAAGALRSSTGGVRFVRTVYVPEDGSCLLILEARTPGAARAVAAAAGLRVARVSEALTIDDRER